MTDSAVIVFPPRNMGEGSQLTSLKPMLTVTVTGSPEPALLGGSGLTVTVPPLMELLVKYSSTTDSMSAVVAPSSTARRAPYRVALVRTCCTITIRPYSIIPNTRRKNTGATMANSTTEAPRRFLRNIRQSLSNLQNWIGKVVLIVKLDGVCLACMVVVTS
jgi:hypothetical protein